jgi:hypothetical protein
MKNSIRVDQKRSEKSYQENGSCAGTSKKKEKKNKNGFKVSKGKETGKTRVLSRGCCFATA